MNKVKLHISENSFEKYKEAITGVIYLEFGDFYFPEKKWNDFIIVMMNNWIASIKSINLKISKDAELMFFDGSLYIKIKMIDDEDCFIECIENHRTNNILFKEQIKFKSLEKEVVNTADLCRTFCKKQNWKSEELDKLDLLLQKYTIKASNENKSNH